MAYEKTEEGYRIEVPDEDHMGPAMRRLNERQRRFVCALSVFGGDATRAYAWAGYKTSTSASAQAASSRLFNSDDIKEAIREETLRRLDYSSLLAISTFIELASPDNTDKKTRLAAAEKLADRTGFHAKTEHKVVVEDRRTTAELIDFITKASIRNGLDPNAVLGLQVVKREALPSPPVIDAEVVELSSDGIEDML